MFLSTERKSFLLIAFCSFFLQACSSSQTNEKKDISLTVDTKSEFPFSTREPEVYQGDFVVNGKAENRSFMARKGQKWRVDFFKNNEPSMAHLNADQLYVIDHKKKLYAVNDGGDPSGRLTQGPTFGYFRSIEYPKFDEVGREGYLIVYKVRSDNPNVVNLSYVDPSSGMIVKQEFKTRNESGEEFHLDYIYEIKNLKLEVDDSVFAIPEGYRKVAWADLWPGKIDLKRTNSKSNERHN